jgi:hypothetical protein
MLGAKRFDAQSQDQRRVDAAADSNDRALAVQRLVDAAAQILDKTFRLLGGVDIQ